MTAAPSRKLLSTEREELIVRSVSEGIKTVSELVRCLRVSEATVRRDLENLEKRGRLVRVHGGAEIAEPIRKEPIFTEKARRNASQKARIAELASALVSDDDTIYLDGGSTVVELAKHLGGKKNLTVVTNSLMAASVLMESGCRLIIAGGEFRPISRTLVGPLTKNILGSLHIRKAFMGTIAFTPERGLTTTDVNEAFTKELVVQQAEQVIVLMDSSKFGKDSFASCGAPADVDIIVTDGGIPPAVEQRLKELNIRIIR